METDAIRPIDMRDLPKRLGMSFFFLAILVFVGDVRAAIGCFIAIAVFETISNLLYRK